MCGGKSGQLTYSVQRWPAANQHVRSATPRSSRQQRAALIAECRPAL